MEYINLAKLFAAIDRGEKPDHIEMLSEIDRAEVARQLMKTKEGIPRDFVCSDKPKEEKNLSKLPHHDKQRIWEVYEKMKRGIGNLLPELLKLREEYPEVPAIYNYIALAFAYEGQNENYFKTLVTTVNKFPDYLFGKTALAEYYLNKGEYKKVAKILNNKFEIQMHFPDTDEIFHISEVQSFYGTVGRYCVKANKMSRAIYCYFIIADIDQNHGIVNQLGDEIVFSEINKMKNNMGF